MNNIMEIRKKVGNIPLIICAAGIIVVDKQNKVLLMRRSDDDNWCIPGGVMELGETVEETAKREVLEETNLAINEMNFFSIYSGESQHHFYPNGDEVYFVNTIFTSKKYSGSIVESSESREIKFFSIQDLPKDISPTNMPFIRDIKNSNFFFK